MAYLTFSIFPNRLTKPVISRFIPTRTPYRTTSPRSAMVEQYRETTGLARNIGFFSTPKLAAGTCCNQRFGQQRSKSHNTKQQAMGGTLFFPPNCIQQIRYSTQRRSYARLNNFLKVPFGPFRPPGPPKAPQIPRNSKAPKILKTPRDALFRIYKTTTTKSGKSNYRTFVSQETFQVDIDSKGIHRLHGRYFSEESGGYQKIASIMVEKMSWNFKEVMKNGFVLGMGVIKYVMLLGITLVYFRNWVVGWVYGVADGFATKVEAIWEEILGRRPGWARGLVYCVCGGGCYGLGCVLSDHM